ncbi:litaf zinc finger [Fusarium pseudocircinatum]|uniref:Litaf zinc finger n=1 Tax=Fusarium pseudocircinatum TaxID=56676 RepID=A0A8H5P166_9HYPO|nr:litaf zinc finger [Fusarium pseudocircinatum]
MENPTPNPEHHQHHAHHSLEDDNKKPSSKRSIEFSSPLAQPPVTNSPPAHLREAGLLSVPLDELKDRSATVICPGCGVRVRTITDEKSGNVTQ